MDCYIYPCVLVFSEQLGMRYLTSKLSPKESLLCTPVHVYFEGSPSGIHFLFKIAAFI